MERKLSSRSSSHWRRKKVLVLPLTFHFCVVTALLGNLFLRHQNPVFAKTNFSDDGPGVLTSASKETFFRPLTSFPTKSKESLHDLKTLVISGSSSSKFCECELVSVDCLDVIKCLPRGESAKQLTATGHFTRNVMKSMARFSWEDPFMGKLMPIGKSIQYITAIAYPNWVRSNLLPIRPTSEHHQFIDESRYPFCVDNNLTGFNCFFKDYNATEDQHDLALLSKEEMMNLSRRALPAIRSDVNDFRKAYKHQKELPALGFLLTFAHIARMRFNLQPLFRDLYPKRLRSTVHVESNDDALSVSVHMRRADSCYHRKEGFEELSSALNSTQQTTNHRLCYSTLVYMNALRRVESISNKTLNVYLASDYAGSVVDEIDRDYPNEFAKWNWYYLDYGTEINYEGNMIEYADENTQAVLGESAVADLFHLSHGSVFIGHLGSRFGKVAWLLATARWNHFIPFQSVDGHSYCCEIDEQCANMKPYIESMENCMTFVHDLSGVPPGASYWEEGSTARKTKYEMDHPTNFSAGNFSAGNSANNTP
jgi:hypothetical protein